MMWLISFWMPARCEVKGSVSIRAIFSMFEREKVGSFTCLNVTIIN